MRYRHLSTRLYGVILQRNVVFIICSCACSCGNYDTAFRAQVCCCRFFQKLNDYRSAIRFLVMSHCHDEAFQLARQHHQMQVYGEILSNSLEAEAKSEDFRSLAVHFEGEHNNLLAGKYYSHAGDHSKVSLRCQCLQLSSFLAFPCTLKENLAAYWLGNTTAMEESTV